MGLQTNHPSVNWGPYPRTRALKEIKGEEDWLHRWSARVVDVHWDSVWLGYKISNRRGDWESTDVCVCVWLLVGYKSSLAKPDKACLIGRIALRGTQQVSVAPGYGVFFHVQWHSCAILTRRIAVAWMLAAWWPFVSPKRGCPAPWRRSPNGLQ